MLQNWLVFSMPKRQCTANNQGAGPHDTSGCSLTNAAPGTELVDAQKKGAAKIKHSVDGAPGDFVIFVRKASTGNSTSSPMD